MTWVVLGAATIAAVGSVASTQLSKGKAGPPPQGGQIAPDQKAAPLQPTAKQFQQPMPPAPAAGQQVAPLPQNAVNAAVMPTVGQNDPLGEYLKRQQQTGYE